MEIKCLVCDECFDIVDEIDELIFVNHVMDVHQQEMNKDQVEKVIGCAKSKTKKSKVAFIGDLGNAITRETFDKFVDKFVFSKRIFSYDKASNKSTEKSNDDDFGSAIHNVAVDNAAVDLDNF